MRRLPALIAALAAAALACPAIAAAHAGPLLGIQDDALLSSTDARAWTLAQGVHPAVIRYNVSWAQVASSRPDLATNPDDPAYNWDAVDRVVEGAAAIGAAPVLTIVQSPRWANGGYGPQWAPRRASDFGAFCAAVALRYSGAYVPQPALPDVPPATAASDAPPPLAPLAPLPAVERFTVWNEPNRGQYLMPQGPRGRTAARLEGALTRACQWGIHDVSPDARVALGPLASRGAQGGVAPLGFLRAYRQAGGPRTDAVALNPYLEGLEPRYVPSDHQPDGAITLRNLDQLEQALRAMQGRSVPIWLTEFAWRTARQPRLGLITPARQRLLTAESVALVRRHYPYVGLMVWFLLGDEAPPSYWQSGLATATLRPKPVYGLWAALSRR